MSNNFLADRSEIIHGETFLLLVASYTTFLFALHEAQHSALLNSTATARRLVAVAEMVSNVLSFELSIVYSWMLVAILFIAAV